jgi:hypothetical protein
MVCLIFEQGEVLLHRLWLRSKELLEQEKEYFEKIKNGNAKIRLDSLVKIFKVLNN